MNRLKHMENDPFIRNLLYLARSKNVRVRLCNFKAHKGLLKGNRIGIDSKLNIAEIRYVLAHEIAHLYLHKDKGDTIHSSYHKEYEEQANRVAELILDLLSINVISKNSEFEVAI